MHAQNVGDPDGGSEVGECLGGVGVRTLATDEVANVGVPHWEVCGPKESVPSAGYGVIGGVDVVHG